MRLTCFIGVLVVLLGLVVAPPVEKGSKAVVDQMYDTKGLNEKEAQEQEYYRYLHQVVGELEKDPVFSKILDNATEEDIKTGKIADMYDLVGHHIRRKVDEVKRLEVEYQRDLLRKKKHHMLEINQNYWNPIHHDNQDTFEKEDLKKLIRKHKDIIEEQDRIRHEEYRKHELQKEHERRETMRNMTAAEKLAAETKFNESHHKQHEKLHEPGHKAQMQEVWEKEDGFDADSFDPKTFFNYHDKNGDGYLDYFEQETLFLNDLEKAYNISDPETDMWERDEEMEKMRQHMLKFMDHDGDGLVSYDEFFSETKTEEFATDDEWKPLIEDDQFTENDYAEYERLLEEARAQADHHEATPIMESHKS